MHGTRRGCTGALLQPPHTARMAYSRNTALASSDQTPRDQPREAGIHSIAPTSHATPLPAALEMEKILGLLAQLPAQVLSPTPYALKARTLHPWSVEGVRTRWLMHQVYLHYLVSTFSTLLVLALALDAVRPGRWENLTHPSIQPIGSPGSRNTPVACFTT